MFRVDDAGRAERREVSVGLRTPGIAQITAGLEAGDRVVRTGHMRVADGVPLSIAEDAPAGAGEA